MTLSEYLFDGLSNRNTGFDSSSIVYVSEQDFAVVLDRAEAERISIYGIEPKYADGGYYGCAVYESYDLPAHDPKWYRAAFAKFKAQYPDILYAISYGYDQD